MVPRGSGVRGAWPECAAHQREQLGRPAGGPARNPTELLAIDQSQYAERVGFCRIISGIQRHTTGPNPTVDQIGEDIWGNADNCRMAHEIAALPDVDGDGNADVVLTSNTSDGGRGSINVYAFSNKYNIPYSPTGQKHWVCILRIVGNLPSSELAYDFEDFSADFNGDGQVDLVASSGWWRPSGNRDDFTGRRQLGAGWVFLLPKKEVFQIVQGDASWPALPGVTFPGGTTLKSPLTMTENDASLVVHNPPSALSVPLDPVADLMVAGDLDGDSIPDLVASAGYTEPRAIEVPCCPIQEGQPYCNIVRGRQGMYAFLSHDGYADGVPADANLVGRLPRYSPDANGTAIQTNTISTISLVPGQADFVIHGDNCYDISPSNCIMGMDFNNASPNDATGVRGEPDMVLLVLGAQNYFNSGKVHMLMNMTSRIVPGGDLSSAVYNNTTVADYTYDTIRASSDPIVTQSVVRNDVNDFPSIIGVGVAGNTDGLGKFDCELGINLVRYVFNVSPAYNRGDAVVLDFPPPGSPSTNPVQLLRVVGEDNQMDNVQPSNLLDGQYWTKLGNQGIGVNQQGCIPEAGWDQDRDGRDDLILRAPFFPGRVEEAPQFSSATGTYLQTIEIDPNAGRPQGYDVDAGRDYFVLSAPKTPLGNVDVPVPVTVNGQPALRFTIVGVSITPEVQPFDTFNRLNVKYYASNTATTPLCTESLNDPIILRNTPQAGQSTIVVDFPSAPIGKNKKGCIRLPTRWKDAGGQGYKVCVPQVQIGGGG